MGSLDKRYYEIGRKYEKVSENYRRPYILGVDINETEKPFIMVAGDHHSDIGVKVVSLEELFSGKLDTHIAKAGCIDFVNRLKNSISAGESFPPRFLKNLVSVEE
ncbi:hypothetical protein MATR_04290 [Marivirga tractuosa]|jgi:hypothetical protein|uniref:Uncharacterized protein n=1 Tax=Marivirga tractuosa (strain ATCC 23168 / DSM 4126 / NBRC 15989 / NCIMB 1408 / VKM B-1430 / H-43) TaxID=643867 RepID=E4TTA7_MARTH|nr:hypothetical protein [Marivirga tractuosa]ADR21937.1 hypothetical protein Ftrac_1952 [Marivirga tractuosa DSM 4126]BDD13604.1 hypothetical protein MATR_04290 [Marivirga tractuosa]